PLTPLHDAIVQGPEAAMLQLTAHPAYTFSMPSSSATVPIPDDDGQPAPQVSVTAADPAAAEPGTDAGSFLISRTGATASPLTVSYWMGGSATNGSDYTSLSGTVVIQAGQSGVTVTLAPLDDSQVEGDETAVLGLTAGQGYTVGTPSSATVTIRDDDPPLVSIV